MKGKSGIYKITCTANGKIYIGSAVLLKKRLGEHKYKLKYNRHENSHLQHAYNKYGKENFEYVELEHCEMDLSIILKREQYYLDTLLFAQEFINSGGKDRRFKQLGYNLNPTAGSPLGFKHSEETKRKTSGENSIWYGKKHSEETKIKMSESRKALNLKGENSPLFGIKKSKEHILKGALNRTGEKNHQYGKERSEEHRNKISIGNKGKNRTVEQRERQSLRMKGNPSPFRKQVTSLNMETGVFEFYPSLLATSIEFGCSDRYMGQHIQRGSIYKNHKFFYN
jgi:group I intron endonuclease